MSDSNTRMEIAIGNDGIITRRRITEEKVDIAESAITELGASVVRKLKSVFEVPGWGMANLCLTEENGYISMVIKNLPLKANYMLQDGIMFPRFSASDHPVMPMVWKTPEDMRLLVMVMLQTSEGMPYIGKQHLIALDNVGRSFRLPLGNLHDDARLCSGEMERRKPTAQAAMCAVLEQLEKGKWQGDLDNKPEETRKLFRFRPKASEFEQLPPLDTWQQLCTKISPSILAFMNI